MKHVYNRHYRKEIVFPEWEDVCKFKKLTAKCSRKYSNRIEAYAIMDTHFHLLIDGRNISKFMMSIQRGYAQYFNNKYKKSGQVFERSYCSKEVDTIEYLRNIKKYILVNPIDRVLEIRIRKMIASRDDIALWKP